MKTPTLNFFTVIFLILFTLSSCELHIGGRGEILNDKNIPIQNAQLYLLLDEKYVDTAYTDKKGEFDIGFMLGMTLSPKIRKTKLIINKDGYEQLIIDLNEKEKDTAFKSWQMKLFLKSKGNK